MGRRMGTIMFCYVHDLGKRIKKQSTEKGEYPCAKGSAKLYDP